MLMKKLLNYWYHYINLNCHIRYIKVAHLKIIYKIVYKRRCFKSFINKFKVLIQSNFSTSFDFSSNNNFKFYPNFNF